MEDKLAAMSSAMTKLKQEYEGMMIDAKIALQACQAELEEKQEAYKKLTGEHAYDYNPYCNPHPNTYILPKLNMKKSSKIEKEPLKRCKPV